MKKIKKYPTKNRSNMPNKQNKISPEQALELINQSIKLMQAASDYLIEKEKTKQVEIQSRLRYEEIKVTENIELSRLEKEIIELKMNHIEKMKQLETEENKIKYSFDILNQLLEKIESIEEILNKDIDIEIKRDLLNKNHELKMKIIESLFK